MEESDYQSLPRIIKLEVASPALSDKQFGHREKERTINKLISIFNIKFELMENENRELVSEQSLRMSEFATAISRFKLNYDEIIEAYRLASEGFLKNDFGETIRFFPTLSTAQCSQILKAYSEMKLQDPKHTAGTEKIKKLIANQKESDETEKKKIWKAEFLKVVKSVIDGKNTFNAINYWDYAISKGGMKQFLALSDDEKTEKIKIKFKEIFDEQSKKENSYVLTKSEKEYISDYLQNQDKGIDTRGADAYKRIEGMAIFQIKNQLVIDWILEEHRKKISK